LDRSCEKRRSVTKSPTNNVEEETIWIGHILGGNCFLKHVTEGKTEERLDITVRRGRRCKQPLDDLQEKNGYCKLKEEAQDRTVCRTGFGSVYGVVKRQHE
jgi:hypothetical protein